MILHMLYPELSKVRLCFKSFTVRYIASKVCLQYSMTILEAVGGTKHRLIFPAKQQNIPFVAKESIPRVMF